MLQSLVKSANGRVTFTPRPGQPIAYQEWDILIVPYLAIALLSVASGTPGSSKGRGRRIELESILKRLSPSKRTLGFLPTLFRPIAKAVLPCQAIIARDDELNEISAMARIKANYTRQLAAGGTG